MDGSWRLHIYDILLGWAESEPCDENEKNGVDDSANKPLSMIIRTNKRNIMIERSFNIHI